MRKAVIFVAATALSATSAQAVGLGDLAKTVLGNGAILQKGSEACPNKVSLGTEESLALSIARQAAESALPAQQFLTLDTVANTQATKQAQAPNFCNTTAKRKNVLLDAVKKAGQKLVTARVLGL